MKNVIRRSKPGTLNRNADRWKRELLHEIQLVRQNGGEVENKFYNKYNQKDVKAELTLMYGKACCYCEAPLRVVTKGHIEHRKPKKGPHAFPESTFEWKNLHLVCPTCNRLKGDKWSVAFEILDAVGDRPLTDHLTYEIDELGVYRLEITPRGKTTIEHADLNRDDLSQDARVKILLASLKAIREIKRLGNNPGVFAKRQILEAKTKREYGTLVRFAITEFLEN